MSSDRWGLAGARVVSRIVAAAALALSTLAACSPSTAVRVTPRPVVAFTPPAAIAASQSPGGIPTPAPSGATLLPTPRLRAAAATMAFMATQAWRATAQAAAGATPTARPTSTPISGILEIKVGDYYFDPAVVTITVGTTVIWKPVGSLYHTIVPREPDDAFPRGGTTGLGSPDYDWTFRWPGTVYYYCDYHPGAMDAVLVVIAGN